MEGFFVVLFAVAIGVAYLAFVWATTESREIRFWAGWAVAGSVVLCFAAVLGSLCGIAENRSELYYERCEGSVPYIPLYGIPALLAAPFLRRSLSGPAILMVGILIVLVAIAVPKQLFSV